MEPRPKSNQREASTQDGHDGERDGEAHEVSLGGRNLLIASTALRTECEVHHVRRRRAGFVGGEVSGMQIAAVGLTAAGNRGDRLEAAMTTGEVLLEADDGVGPFPLHVHVDTGRRRSVQPPVALTGEYQGARGAKLSLSET